MAGDPHRFEVPEPEGWRWLAASVHLFTALGVVCALLAVLALLDKAYEAAFIWLGVALIIDGIDGTFARALDVKQRLPRFSGEKLDQIVDYLTYVFVPALVLQLGGYLQGIWGGVLASLILLSSLYHFIDHDNKADDHCFVGFPAIWNIVAFYVFAFELPGWAVAVLVLACVALTFVPMRWLHPMRVRAFRPINLTMSGLWIIAATWTVVAGFPAGAGASAALGLVALYGIALTVLWPLFGSGDEA